MAVIEFPRKVEPVERRVCGIQACLDYLHTEALGAQMHMVAHLIGAAREAAQQELDRLRVTSNRA